MPEKQAKEFGQIESNEMFTLKPAGNNPSDDGSEPILDISDEKSEKLLLRQKFDKTHFTGNPITDTYRRINDYFVDHSKIKIRDKAVTFRLLAVMINSGLSLIKSLKTLSLQSKKNPKLEKILLQMALEIENGKSLSLAMENFPEVFNEAQVGMVKSGEASGQLNVTLKNLADEMEKTANLMSKIKGAMVYPVMILFLLVIVIFIMMIAVVPQLTKLFEQTGNELPLATKILINVSSFSVNYWPLIVILFFGMIGGVILFRKNARYSWDSLMLRLPIFGSVIKKALLSKFSRSLSNLLTCGVPIIKSLEITANAMGNEVYKKRLFLTAEDMRRGIPMAENLTDSNLFPTMVVNMIEVGEQTAQLENIILKVADFYDEEVDTTVKSLTKIMEPLILAVIGVTVGGLVAAIMLPIISLTNLAGALG